MMSGEYRDAQYSSLLEPPIGEVVLPRDDFRAIALGATATDYLAIEVCNKEQRLREAVDGYAYVEMNTSGRLENESSEDGIIFTSSLAGCTGLAGFARHEDGRTLQFIGHFTPAAERTIINESYREPLNAIGSGKTIITPSPRITVPTPYNMAEFYDWVAKEGASKVQMLIAYGGRDHPYEYFDVRHYFTTFNEAVTRITELDKPSKQTLLLPYNGDNGNLAAGRMHGQEGIFWNGVRVDFDKLTDTSSNSTGLPQ